MYKYWIKYVINNFEKLVHYKRGLLETDEKKRAELGRSNEISVTIEALDNPKYKWRTINGIASETAQKPEIVNQVMETLINEGVAISSSTRNPRGEILYTSKQQYFRKKFALNRILSVLSDKVK